MLELKIFLQMLTPVLNVRNALRMFKSGLVLNHVLVMPIARRHKNLNNICFIWSHLRRRADVPLESKYNKIVCEQN